MSGSVSKRSKNKRPSPFPLRLSDEERAELHRRVGELALGAYIKSELFTHAVKKRYRGARTPIKDHQALAKVLAALGANGLADSLERLATAAETGVLQWDVDAPAAIQKACADIVTMRLLLMKALGFQINEAELSQSLRQTFTQAASDAETE